LERRLARETARGGDAAHRGKPADGPEEGLRPDAEAGSEQEAALSG
jgi:hypothetical protein